LVSVQTDQTEEWEMEKIKPKSALYIKLGGGGDKEEECLQNGTIYGGWDEIPYELCVIGNKWEEVRDIFITKYHKDKGAATRKMKQMRNFYESDSQTLWVTFYKEHLYWCFANEEIELLSDNSKRRKTLNGWSCYDFNGNELWFSNISGSILQTQTFRGTICGFSDEDVAYLTMKINGDELPCVNRVNIAKTQLVKAVQEIIASFHYKEFELLVDLIFREAGSLRIGELGGHQKDIDIELFSPVTKETYIVQVKATAGMEEYNKFSTLLEKTSRNTKYYFVVNNPSKELFELDKNADIRCWFAEDIAQYVVTYGLVNWVIGKAK
jgi:hypothetical protein